MKTNRYFKIGLPLILALVILPAWYGLAQAQKPGPASPETANAVTAAITPVMGYQGRLAESGAPVNGSRSMTFRLYTASSGGTLIWAEGPKTITVTNGLFYTALGEVTPFDTSVMNNMDQNLWLEVIVGSTTLPRQRLMGAPYAFSLAPGADIEGNMAAGQSVLKALNTGAGYGILGESIDGYGIYALSNTGHGMYARSGGSGLAGAGLLAEATGTNGVAAWALSNSTDTTLVASNDGSGPLFKGFGGNGGEHEFIILNDGTVEQDRAANGLVKAAVTATCGTSVGITRSFTSLGGTITISPGGSAGSCTVNFGATIDDRYWIASAPTNADRLATCTATSGTSLNCFRFNAAGEGVSGTIMILVY